MDMVGLNSTTERKSRPRRPRATQRERQRMQLLNQAFENLRRVVPRTHLADYQKLSKIATLRLAIQYIRAMSQIMDCANNPSASVAGHAVSGANVDQQQQLVQQHPGGQQQHLAGIMGFTSPGLAAVPEGANDRRHSATVAAAAAAVCSHWNYHDNDTTMYMYEPFDHVNDLFAEYSYS